MAQELTSDIAVIGGGPAGCVCAKFLSDCGFNVTVFDKSKILQTLLPTGGGKCNLAHNINDFKELAANYPRGEKFLYSVFSKFATAETLDFFKSIGVETYTREDGCVFPVSNSAKDVRNKILKTLKCKFINEEVLEIIPPSAACRNKYKLITGENLYAFDLVVIATGGHSGYEILKNLDIKIVPPTQSLVGLITKEDFSELAGVSINGILFTHKGVSGPEIYKISSLRARDNIPYTIPIKLIGDFDLQTELNNNPHKEIKNLLGQYIPKSLATYILNKLQINTDTKCHQINGKMRDNIYTMLVNFKITVIGKVTDGEVVTCGGVNLKEINPKTLESKKYKGLYFCGEVLDIDGFCGGFNLQNCWSTAYIVANTIGAVVG